ncbi:glycosyltransferase family 4 protein [Nocardioides bigeumensis]|uniref:Glycosyltransferase family 4 protein n=1 Tax=Nocardioides bigeumensis TaxID=433657 RepID=A0ABN2YGW2_9ACTN
MSPFLVALLAALGLTGVLLPVLRRADVMDVPNARSSHAAPIPRGGGIGVYAALLVACGVAAAVGGEVGRVPLLVGLGLAVVGLVDDLRGLSGPTRLVLQVLAGIGVAAWAAESVEATAGRWVTLTAIVVLVVGFVNAFNFMDGVNGISALSGTVAGLWFGYVGGRVDEPGLSTLGLALAGALLGFLPWNAPRARVFLGDVGSYGVGLVIASMCAWAWVSGAALPLAVAPLVVYGADTAWVLVKRARGRRPLMEAHREHVYQRLVDGLGWSHLGAATAAALASALVCLAAWLGRDVPVLSVTVAVAVAAAYLSLPRLATRQKAVHA